MQKSGLKKNTPAFHFHFDELNDKLFNPLLLNDNKNGFRLDLDLDLQYINYMSDHLKRNYYTENSFNKSMLNVSNNFSLFHTDIRSAVKSLDNYATYLSNLNHKFSIIGLSETWPNGSKADMINVVGYHCIHKHSCDRSGGGVSIFVRDCIKCKPTPDLDIFYDNMASVFTEMDRNEIIVAKSEFVFIICRPPNTDPNLLTSLLEETLSD